MARRSVLAARHGWMRSTGLARGVHMQHCGRTAIGLRSPLCCSRAHIHHRRRRRWNAAQR
eukprot:611783-Prymnesium_polylepis.1